MSKPSNPIIERVALMERLLIGRATGAFEFEDDGVYQDLRRELLAQPELRARLPRFVQSCRDFGAFWSYIKNEAAHYEERRVIIRNGLAPLMDYLEGNTFDPADQVITSALQSFDAEGVHAVWNKALSRRSSDPEGSITIARTLLETVCKRILDECATSYSAKDDLPKLYSMAARALKLAPDQHTEEPIKAILGGAMNLVNGLGTLRNRLSDAHGRGGRLPVKPSPRHANLAVNTAGAVATFLVETYLEKGQIVEPLPA